jgi:ElaB/YqjD/DUF883 family membrane-anchored ribosome-binding protein
MSELPEDRDTEAGEPQSPDEIRAEIERTQQQLGDTVEALAAKTDVKAQAAERVQAARDTVSDAVGSARQSAEETVASARDSVLHASDQVRQATPESAAAGAQQVTDTVSSQPLPFAAGGAFAAGVLVGWLLGRR